MIRYAEIIFDQNIFTTHNGPVSLFMTALETQGNYRNKPIASFTVAASINSEMFVLHKIGNSTYDWKLVYYLMQAGNEQTANMADNKAEEDGDSC